MYAIPTGFRAGLRSPRSKHLFLMKLPLHRASEPSRKALVFPTQRKAGHCKRHK